MIDPKTAQLTAVNEALAVLDYGMASRDVLPGDVLIVEACELLHAARRKLTDKDWPEGLVHPQIDSRRYVVWHLEKEEQQKKDGRA